MWSSSYVLPRETMTDEPRKAEKIFLSASELFALPACGDKTDNTMMGPSQICT